MNFCMVNLPFVGLEVKGLRGAALKTAGLAFVDVDLSDASDLLGVFGFGDFLLFVVGVLFLALLDSRIDGLPSDDHGCGLDDEFSEAH